jgi:hypothetical protein
MDQATEEIDTPEETPENIYYSDGYEMEEEEEI